MRDNGIAISGKAGAGKNALAEHLAAGLVEEGEWPVYMAFGDELKRITFLETGLVKSDPGGREAMLRIGKRERERNVNVFRDALRRRYDDAVKCGLFPIVTDVRMFNEYAECYRLGMFLVRVNASDEHREIALRTRDESGAVWLSTHPTETDLDGAYRWHYVLHNYHGVTRLDNIAAEILRLRRG